MGGRSETRTRADLQSDRLGAARTAGAFARALLDGDADGAAGYFGPMAQLLTADGTELCGRESITALIAQLITPDQQLQIRAGRTVATRSVALCTQFWTRGSSGLRSEPYDLTSTARLVLGRSGARWQIMIAAPWG